MVKCNSTLLIVPQELVFGLRQSHGVERSKTGPYYKWLKISSEKDHTEAYYFLGLCTVSGEFVEGEEAIKWFLKAAEKGHAQAQCCVAMCYDFGNDVAEDKNEAFKWYQKSASQGFADAQFHLGYCYKNGLGVVKDDIQAYKWYEEAAKQNHEDARSHLMFCNAGLSPDRDELKFFEWLTIAMMRGDAEAQFNVGLCYVFGRGVDQDLEQGYEWVKKAAKNGSTNAKVLLEEYKNKSIL